MSDCHTSGLTPLEAALDHVFSATSVISATHVLPLANSIGYVTAEDIISPLNVPPFDNSAMDGYALNSADWDGSTPLPVVGKSMAGSPFGDSIPRGSCVRIMTGAKIPTGANAVVMQEQANVTESGVSFQIEIKPGQNIRTIGEDISTGQVVLPKGTRLTPREIPLLASLGISDIHVYQRVKVAFFSTGDELKEPTQTLAEGEIFDSNRYCLKALLERMHCETIDLGIVPDDREQLRNAFLSAQQAADLVITSGGVSVGDADYTKEILAQEGEIGFWKVAIKPGKPFAFGTLHNTLYCGLPGNPVSTLVTFWALVQPLIEKLAGHTQWSQPQPFNVIASSDFRKQPGRTDFQRAVMSVNENGELTVSSAGNQNSNIFNTLSSANCFAVLERERGNIVAGEKVAVLPFNAILYA